MRIPCLDYPKCINRRCLYLLVGSVSLGTILFWMSRAANRETIMLNVIKSRVDSQVILHQANSNRQIYDILLIGYLRSGSTFLGEILGIRERHFYVYEPLIKMATYQYFKPGYKCDMGVNRCTKSNGKETEALKIVQAVYTCQHDILLKHLDRWQLCKARGNRICDPDFCKHNETGCARRKLDHCSSSVSRVSKVLRLSISLAKKLLDTVPSLKIIHLLRDPRAILYSRQRVNLLQTKDIKSLCKKMKDDYEVSKQLKLNNPNKIYTVFYEDLTMNPAETVKAIYDFVGYDFGTNDMIRLKNMTRFDAAESVWLPRRQDSAKTAYAWRRNISFSTVKNINKACGDIYEALGYPGLNNESELHNNSIPLRLF